MRGTGGLVVKTVARWLEVAGGFLPLRFTLLFVLFFFPGWSFAFSTDCSITARSPFFIFP